MSWVRAWAWLQQLRLPEVAGAAPQTWPLSEVPKAMGWGGSVKLAPAARPSSPSCAADLRGPKAQDQGAAEVCPVSGLESARCSKSSSSWRPRARAVPPCRAPGSPSCRSRSRMPWSCCAYAVLRLSPREKPSTKSRTEFATKAGDSNLQTKTKAA